MKNKALAITLGICEIKRLLKFPIFYVIITILIFATLDVALELFQSPYDTREKYEERLGYVSYQDLRGYDEIAFLEEICRTSTELQVIIIKQIIQPTKKPLNYGDKKICQPIYQENIISV